MIGFTSTCASPISLHVSQDYPSGCRGTFQWLDTILSTAIMFLYYECLTQSAYLTCLYPCEVLRREVLVCRGVLLFLEAILKMPNVGIGDIYISGVLRDQECIAIRKNPRNPKRPSNISSKPPCTLPSPPSSCSSLSPQSALPKNPVPQSPKQASQSETPSRSSPKTSPEAAHLTRS